MCAPAVKATGQVAVVGVTAAAGGRDCDLARPRRNLEALHSHRRRHNLRCRHIQVRLRTLGRPPLTLRPRAKLAEQRLQLAAPLTEDASAPFETAARLPAAWHLAAPQCRKLPDLGARAHQ